MLIFVMCLLSGCKQTYTVKVNNDDTVDFAIRVVISKDTYNMLSSFNVNTKEMEDNKVLGMSAELDDTSAVFQETAAFFQNRGYTLNPLDDAVEMGFEVSKSFMNPQEFNEEIAYLYNNHFSGLYLDIKNQKTYTSNTYQAYGTLEVQKDSDLEQMNETAMEAFENQFDLSSVKSEVYIYMPNTTTVTATDGDQTVLQGSTFWSADYGQQEQTPVHVISSYKDDTIIYAGAAVGIVVLLILFVVVSRLIKRKGEKQKSARNDESYKSEE